MSLRVVKPTYQRVSNKNDLWSRRAISRRRRASSLCADAYRCEKNKGLKGREYVTGKRDSWSPFRAPRTDRSGHQQTDPIQQRKDDGE